MITKGWTLLFAGGPPWNWRPSFQRGKRVPGWSLTWLWWGLHYVPLSSAVVLAGTTLLKEALDEEAKGITNG